MTSGDERYPIHAKTQVLRPIPFLASFLVVGMLFAVQQWLSARIWYPQAGLHLFTVMAAWGLQYLLWGVLCLFLWRWLGQTLQTAGWRYILLRIVPLSILMSVAVEMALVACFPQFPATKVRMSYWRRLNFELTMEFLENTAVFWATFAILRARGHYRESRQRERAMSELAVELAEARMLALRMQINPHFLFNTMNAISSLMYSDVSAADRMIEQLSSMLRVSLERGSKQLIRLREEMEFIEMYLSLQDIRSPGLARQEMRIDPKLYDTLVPAMILQPLVENAYVHGLSRLTDRGLIEITAESRGSQLTISVRNRGVGLSPAARDENCGAGIGLANIKSRLRLHFGDQGHLEIREVAPDLVEVNVTFPLVLATENDCAEVIGREPITRR